MSFLSIRSLLKSFWQKRDEHKGCTTAVASIPPVHTDFPAAFSLWPAAAWIPPSELRAGCYMFPFKYVCCCHVLCASTCWFSEARHYKRISHRRDKESCLASPLQRHKSHRCSNILALKWNSHYVAELLLLVKDLLPSYLTSLYCLVVFWWLFACTGISYFQWWLKLCISKYWAWFHLL